MSRFFVASLLFALTFAAPALAMEPVPFTAQDFAAAQAAGKPVLVHVTAPWCPVCAKQHPILSQLEKTAELGDVVVFDVDFDHQKDVLRTLNVQMQSTLIVYSGKDEKGRATGITDPAEIKALLLKSKGA